MAAAPAAGDVYNNAQAMRLDSRTPGMNLVVESWATLQDFTGGWAQYNYNRITNVTNLTQELWP